MGGNGPRTDALAKERVAWIASVRPDGRSISCRSGSAGGEAILVFSQADAHKVRNLAFDPRAMVAVGEAGADMRNGLFEAVAELGPSPLGLPDTLVDKYRDPLTHLGPSAQRFAEPTVGDTCATDQVQRPCRGLHRPLIASGIPAGHAHLVGISLGGAVAHALLAPHADDLDRAIIDGAGILP